MDEHIRATEPKIYTIYDWEGVTMHLCDCESDLCTFYSCNITDQPSKCEVVGCKGKITTDFGTCGWGSNALSEQTGCWGHHCQEKHMVSCNECTFTYRA
jgi:hypothetical protein